MNLESKKIIYLLLLFNVSLCATLRYISLPILTSGSPDSWDYNLVTNQLIVEGKIIWAFNLLSYFGLYPPYTEVAMEFVYGSFSLLGGTDLSISYLIVSNVCIGLLPILFMFILCRSLSDNSLIAIFASILLSCSPLFFQSSVWSIEHRLLASAFSIIILFILSESMKGKRKYLALLFLSFPLLAIHRSILFIVVYIFCFAFYRLMFILNLDKYVYPTVISIKGKNQLLSFTIILYALTIIIGALLNSDTILPISLFDYGVELSMDLGLFSVLLIFSLFGMFSYRLTNYRLNFLLIIFLVLIIHFTVPQPRGLVREPSSFYIFYPIYFIMMSFGLFFILKSFKSRSQGYMLIIASFLLFLPSPVFLNIQGESEELFKLEMGQSNDMSNSKLESTGIYIESISTENSNLLYMNKAKSDRLEVYSGGLYYDSDRVNVTRYSDYDWNLVYFFTSKKAEGFVEQESFRYPELDSHHFKQKNLDNNQIKQYLLNYDIGIIILSLEEYPEIYVLLSDINDLRYALYEDEYHQIINY